MKTRTPWFAPDVLPVRRGLYLVDYAEGRVEDATEYQYFDKVNWYSGSNTTEEAYKMYKSRKLVRNYEFFPRRWAGLMKCDTFTGS